MNLWLYISIISFMKLDAPVFEGHVFRILMSLLMECSLNQNKVFFLLDFVWSLFLQEIIDTCFISRFTCFWIPFSLLSDKIVSVFCAIVHFLEVVDRWFLFGGPIYYTVSSDWELQPLIFRVIQRCVLVPIILLILYCFFFPLPFLLNGYSSMIYSFLWLHGWTCFPFKYFL